MSSGDDLEGFGVTGNKHWYLDLSAQSYEQEDNFMREDGQTQAQFDSTYNLSLEPDETLDLELEPGMSSGDPSLGKRHTVPYLGSTSSHYVYPTPFAPLSFGSPKRAETYPTTTEGLNIARNQRLIENLLSKIDPGTVFNTPESEDKPSDITNVAQSLPGCEEWPVPTFFLDPLDLSTPPELEHTEYLTPEDLEHSPKPFANPQARDIDYTQTNDYCSMAEDMDSVPPLNDFFDPSRVKSTSRYKITNSDSGIGSSTMSYRHGANSIITSSNKNTQSRRGGKASTRGSQAHGSVMIEKGSLSNFTTVGTTGIYKQVAAKLGPLTSAASSTARSVERTRMLSETALKTMKTIILEPILGDEKFRDFWYICTMAGEQMESGQIGSLRDLEKFLFHKASNIKNNQAYNIFCKEFLSHVRESLNYMPEDELLRSYDRPYDSGYFLDIMSRFDKSTMGMLQEDDEEFDPAFEKWLDSTKSEPKRREAEGLAENSHSVKRVKANRPASTVPGNFQSFVDCRFDNSAPTSYNGGPDITFRKPGLMGPPARPQLRAPPAAEEAPKAVARVKRTKGKCRKQGLDQDSQQPKKALTFRCGWKDQCNLEFTRRCDWTKHRKTHERPHKCTVAGCKYATEGFPTEKERDRHWRDKHSSETPSYHCLYKPCLYKSKRDSNCKQHMEKAHGYIYNRMKQGNKAKDTKRDGTSSTSPEHQESPTGISSSFSNQDDYVSVSQPLPMATPYQTTDYQPLTTEFTQNGMDQYSSQDMESQGLRPLLLFVNGPHTSGINSGQQQGHYTLMPGNQIPGQQQDHCYSGMENSQESESSHVTGGSFDNSNAYTPQNNGLETLPYPDAVVDPSLFTFTSLPDVTIDPTLEELMMMDEAHNLMQYSNMVT